LFTVSPSFKCMEVSRDSAFETEVRSYWVRKESLTSFMSGGICSAADFDESASNRHPEGQGDSVGGESCLPDRDSGQARSGGRFEESAAQRTPSSYVTFIENTCLPGGALDSLAAG